jgi:mycoredoxin
MRSRILYAAKAAALFSVFLSLGYFGPALAGKIYHSVFPPTAYTIGDYSKLQDSAGSNVVIFTESGCPWCAQARQLLGQRSIDYREYSIDSNPDAMKRYAELGEAGVPVLVIGARKIVGFREAAIIDALAQLPPTR